MISSQARKQFASAVAAAALLAGAGAASAQTSTTSTKAPKTSKAKVKDANRTPETLLTGAIADQVKAAALVAVPGGTVVRVENDNNDGAAYEAHVTKADGSAVKVTFDANVKVVAITADGPGKDGGKGGRGNRGNKAPLTGAIADQVKAAALAAVPGGTVTQVEADDHDGAAYEAHVTKADGTEVEVTFDANVKVIEIKAHGQGGHGGRGGDGKDGGRGGRHGRTKGSTTIAK